MKHLALAVLLLTPLALYAQAVPADTGATDATTGGSGTQTSPSPPRTIMPLTINHKPNPTNPPAEIAEPIDHFFKTLKTGDYTGAYETFFLNTRLGAQKEKMAAFSARTQEAFGIYGALNDYEIFDNYSVGSHVLVLTYLTRHDLQPLRWRFVYYQADKDWKLINMGFDDYMLDTLD
jgi:hypothetical protein